PRFPGLIVGARLGSPLVVGLGQGEAFLASDPSALVGYSEKVVYMDDRQMCVLSPHNWRILQPDRELAVPAIHQLDWEPEDSELGQSDHYMLKEIYEQPEVLERAMAGRLDDANSTAHFGGLHIEPRQLCRIDRMVLTACGTSYHAALLGEYLIEEFA